MAKINYSDSEKFIIKLQDKILKNKIIESCPQKDTKKNESEEKHTTTFKEQVIEKAIDNIQHKLKNINYKTRQSLFKNLNIDPKKMKKYLLDPSSMKKEDLLKIKDINAQIQTLASIKDENKYNQRLLKYNRKEQKNRRWNVNKGWLAL